MYLNIFSQKVFAGVFLVAFLKKACHDHQSMNKPEWLFTVNITNYAVGRTIFYISEVISQLVTWSTCHSPLITQSTHHRHQIMKKSTQHMEIWKLECVGSLVEVKGMNLIEPIVLVNLLLRNFILSDRDKLEQIRRYDRSSVTKNGIYQGMK